MAFFCKICGTKLRTRTSNDITENTRQVYYECTNSACCAEYSGKHVLGEMVRPSKLVATSLLDFFINSLHESKRAAVLKVLNG